MLLPAPYALRLLCEPRTVDDDEMSTGYDDTTADLEAVDSSRPAPQPGLALVFSVGRPCLRIHPLGQAPLRVGRGTDAHVLLEDPTASRLHAEVAITPGGLWLVRDRGRHGTYVDGRKVEGAVSSTRARTIRIGENVLVCVPDVRPYLGGEVHLDGDIIVGPVMQRVHADLVRAASEGVDVLVSGESGAGKEYAARRYHEARAGSSASAGPLVAVNCATISAALFEAELFGHARGAFSGADRERVGLFEAAHGGTLFLDEVGEIPLELQAKLLRVLQERSFRRVGESRERPVDVRVVGATNRPLPHGELPTWLRADLFYRMARGVVRLPPLRERWEEIAYMVHRELARTGQVPAASLVEACLLQEWPGNARELLAGVRRAAVDARDHEVLRRKSPSPVGAQWLPYRLPEVASETEPPAGSGGKLSPEEITTALAKHEGNVSAAAEELGVHRNTLHRHMKKLGLEP